MDFAVTATKSAIAALDLLRENKNKFDLVVSDVHMPNMDGFQLLEFVGLEMDLPVIMLSVNDDPKMVMKGIHHGACDYLLKPVRIEELRNIWQHVIRRRKNNNLKQCNKASNNQGKPNYDGCYETGLPTKSDSDQNQKPSKKRRDPDEDDYEENENGHDSEVLSTQKKPRIVWNTDLHRKFVAAVNELGVDKAVPKKILEIMKEERLTRENVASHLQKYRLYLKRISQQANMIGGLVGGADTSYLRMGSLNGIGHFNKLSGPEKYHNNAYRSFSCGGITGRYNTSVGLNVHGLPPSETLQTLNNSMNDPLRFQSGIVHGNQNGIQGIPMSVGLDQLQQNRGVGVSPIQNLASHFGAKSAFPLSTKLPDQVQKVTMGCAATPSLDISNNALVMKANPQDTQGSGVYDNSQFSFPMLDNGRWSSPMQPCGTNSYQPPIGNFRLRPTDNMSCANLQGGNMSTASSISSLSSQSPDSLTDIFTNNIPGQISNGVSFQGWNDINLDSGFLSSVIDNTMDSLISMNGNVDPEGHSSMNSNLDFSFCNPLQMKHDEVMGLSDEASLKPQEGNTMSQQKTW